MAPFSFVGVRRIIIFFWVTVVVSSRESITQHTGDASGNEYTRDSSYFFYQQSEYPRDCMEVHNQCSSDNYSGVYFIKPVGFLEPFEALCDNTEDQAGWTVIHRRNINGSVFFSRDWESYKHGFGFLTQEFWIGNEKLAYMTSQKNYKLLIKMTASDETLIHVTYNNFRISDEGSEYKLVSLDQYRGELDHITWCPENLHYGDCTCGKRACESPNVCLDTCAVDIPDHCVPCPEGFYMKEEECVPQGECGCYFEEDGVGLVISEGEVHVKHDCSRRILSFDGQITSSGYRCSTDAVCGIRDGVRGCYCGDGYSGKNGECFLQETVRDCQDLYDAGIRENGVYTILPTNWTRLAFPVYCNMTDGGGWTVFQRRVDGSEDFYRDRASYKRGFGNLRHEFWLGNDKLSYLTNQRDYQIRIDLVNRDGAPYYAKFASFRIDSEEDNYRLSGIGTYSGTADSRSSADGYALTYHRGRQFSTKDRDLDTYSGNCAVNYHGAWWYSNCHYSNLNGDYHAASNSYASVRWKYLPGSDSEGRNIKFSEMKLRPV